MQLRRTSWLANRRVGMAMLLLAGAGFPRVGFAQLLTEFPVPTVNATLHGVAAGPDGNVWFTETIPSKIGRITPTGTITEFTIPQPFDFPHVIAAGPDGNLWFMQTNSKIGRITPRDRLPSSTFPRSITATGSWQVRMGTSGLRSTGPFMIGRITPTGRSPSSPAPGAGRPWTITAGRTAISGSPRIGNRIGQITTAGVVTEFPLPSANSNPRTITAGPDGNLWFTEDLGNRIGRITTAGSITEFPLQRLARRSESQRGPTAISGSRPSKASGELPRPAPSRSSRSPCPLAVRLTSRPVRTGISGLRRVKATKSGA